METDPLVLATYALVIATTLLVVATAIPAVQRAKDVKASRAATAARLVPDMNILHSRLNGTVRRLVRKTTLSLDELDALLDDVHDSMELAGRLKKDCYNVGLKFANEIYVTLHFMTAAASDLCVLAREAETDTGGRSRHDLARLESARHSTPGAISKEARISKMCAYYVAAEISLTAAEDLMPASTRTVDQKSFWDRYTAIVDEREKESEKALVDLRASHSR